MTTNRTTIITLSTPEKEEHEPEEKQSTEPSPPPITDIIDSERPSFQSQEKTQPPSQPLLTSVKSPNANKTVMDINLTESDDRVFINNINNPSTLGTVSKIYDLPLSLDLIQNNNTNNTMIVSNAAHQISLRPTGYLPLPIHNSIYRLPQTQRLERREFYANKWLNPASDNHNGNTKPEIIEPPQRASMYNMFIHRS